MKPRLQKGKLSMKNSWMHTIKSRWAPCSCRFVIEFFDCLVDLACFLFYFQTSSTNDRDEESDKSKSEVHDEEDEASGEVASLDLDSLIYRNNMILLCEKRDRHKVCNPHILGSLLKHVHISSHNCIVHLHSMRSSF